MSLPEPGIEPGTSSTEVRCVTSGLSSQLKVSIVVKLFYFFNAMGRNVNTLCRICVVHVVNKLLFFFCIILTCKDYISQFLIFTGVSFTAYISYMLHIRCKQVWPNDTDITSLNNANVITFKHDLKVIRVSTHFVDIDVILEWNK